MTPSETVSPFITVQAAADALAVSRWMIYRVIWDGNVESVQVGRCRRVVRRSFEAYVSTLLEEATR
jgi:excisionase family DNA binding protein